MHATPARHGESVREPPLAGADQQPNHTHHAGCMAHVPGQSTYQAPMRRHPYRWQAGQQAGSMRALVLESCPMQHQGECSAMQSCRRTQTHGPRRAYPSSMQPASSPLFAVSHVHRCKVQLHKPAHANLVALTHIHAHVISSRQLTLNTPAACPGAPGALQGCAGPHVTRVCQHG